MRTILNMTVHRVGKIRSSFYHNLSGPYSDNCILIMKAKEMHCFSDLFDKVLYMFQTGPLPIIRSISTLYTRNRYSYLSCWFCWRLLAWSAIRQPVHLVGFHY